MARLAMKRWCICDRVYCFTIDQCTHKQACKLLATLVRNYHRLTHLLTGVKCRATSVAKKCKHVEAMWIVDASTWDQFWYRDNLFTLPLSQDYHCQEEAPEKQKSHVGAPKGHYEPPVSLIYYLKLFDRSSKSQLQRKAEIQCVIVNLQPEKKFTRSMFIIAR